MAGLIDKENKNNHAGVERREASERAEALLGVINEYRVYAHRFESLPTWDVLEICASCTAIVLAPVITSPAARHRWIIRLPVISWG